MLVACIRQYISILYILYRIFVSVGRFVTCMYGLVGVYATEIVTIPCVNNSQTS